MKSISKKTLTVLHTPLGVRSLYDSVCFCNRCGMCAPVCPAYMQTPQENNSPRARNQALRLLLEQKLNVQNSNSDLKTLVNSCTLCGRCTQVCPGQIPTAQHMLELRRLLNLRLVPYTLFKLLRLRQTGPRLFYLLVRAGLLLRYTGLMYLLSFVPGFRWLKHLCEIVPLHSGKPFTAPEQMHPTLVYLPSLEAEFLLSGLAQSIYQIASQKYRTQIWKNTSCGLFEYLYGDIQRARKIVRNLITRHQQTANGKLPVLTDSIDVYLFLKQAPQLFSGLDTWESKAARFARCVWFVTDLLPKKMPVLPSYTPPVLLMQSALFDAQSHAQIKTAQILQTLFKKNLVQCGYKDACIAPAGYGFIKGSRAPFYNLQAVRTVAAHQAQTAIVLSGLAELELNYYLRQFYPAAKAHHIARLNG